MDIAIAGAGIFGWTAALELARRGHSVTVVAPDLGPRARAASDDLNKAVRPDYGPDAFYTDLMIQALDGWAAWNERAGEALYNRVGMVFLTRAPLDRRPFERASFDVLSARGLAPERLDAEAIATRYPVFAGGRFVDGYFNPHAGWARANRVLEVVAEWGRRAGVVVRSGRVVALSQRRGRVTGLVLEGSDRLDADAVVVAAGAWTPILVPELAAILRPTIQPVFLLAPEPIEALRPPRLPVWAADISQTGWYGFPALESGVLKAANHGPGHPVRGHLGDDLDTIAYPDVRAFLADAMPGLADTAVARRHGCAYCDTPDGDFWIARHPARPGLTVAAGGSGHAFKFAPVLGAIIADAVNGLGNPAGARFGWRPARAARGEAARQTLTTRRGPPPSPSDPAE